MRILFLGDVVGISGCSKLTSNLLNEIDKNKIDFVIVKAIMFGIKKKLWNLLIKKKDY